MLLSTFILPFTGVRTLNEEKVRLAPHVLEQKGAGSHTMLRESAVKVFLRLL